MIEEYLNKKTWLVKENANLTYSFAGLMNSLSQSQIKEYCLTKMYSKKVAQAHQNGAIHIHNLGFGIVGYCAGWNLKQLLYEGFNGVPGKSESSAPKKLSVAMLQMANFMGTVQNEWAGAQAFNSVDTLLAPFVRYNNLSYEEVKQATQEMIYNFNITSRWGGQCPFTNMTFDLVCPKDLAKQRIVWNGKTQRETYSEFQKEMDWINKAFCEVMIEGDMNGRVFTFPIPTYNITKEFDWESPISDFIFETSAKYGLPYFSNFVNSDMSPEDVRSMCCHLRLDLRELKRKYTAGLFGNADCTGSLGVVTINLPRIGYLAKTEKDFFKKLDVLMNTAKESLEVKRKVIKQNIKNGLMPFTKRYLPTLDNHFSTIGIIGMTECTQNFLGKGIDDAEAKAFALRVLKHIKKRLYQYQKQTKHFYNLEATPAEGASYRLAKLDKERYPRIRTGSSRVPRYTSSTYLPVNYTKDMLEAIEHQEELQVEYTGGTVFHAFLGERVDVKGAKAFVRKVMENTRIPYFTLTPTFSICMDHGYLKGEHKKCHCGKETEVYSRVVGYLRPVKNWNPGKQEEFKQRKEYSFPRK